MPCWVASFVPGIHSQPPERAVVPPKSGSFSTTMTLSPWAAAVTAVAMPDAPEPTTRTSHSTTKEDEGDEGTFCIFSSWLRPENFPAFDNVRWMRSYRIVRPCQTHPT